MSDARPPTIIFEGLDPAPEAKSAVKEASEAVTAAAHRVGDVVHGARKPGMPLSILSSVVRQAPLGSFLVAFLLGIFVARRR